MNRKRLTITALIVLSLGAVIGVYAGTVGVNDLFGFTNGYGFTDLNSTFVNAGTEFYLGGVNYTQFIASRYGSDQSLNTTDGVTFAGVTAGEYFLNAVNITETFYGNVGATAYVGNDSYRSYQTNYFYTGDYGTHTLLFAAAVDYVGVLGGGSISLEAMTFTGILVVDEDEVTVYGQGWDTFINGAAEGHAITVSGDRCVIRDLKCGTTTGGGNAYYGIFSSGANLLVDNVYVDGSDNIGILLIGIESRLINCYIFDTDTVGVQIQGANSVVANNGLKTIGASGVSLSATSDESIVSNNVIDTTGADGIEIDAAAENCVVEGNFITGWTGEAIDDNSLTASIGNDNWAGAGSYETQAGGAWIDPTVVAGGEWAGRMIQVYNSNLGQYRTYVYLNGGWRYVALT